MRYRPSRILGACTSIRAPSRSPDPRSGQRRPWGVLQLPESFAPAARSEPPGGSLKPGSRQLALLDALQAFPDLRYRPHIQSARRISGSKLSAARSEPWGISKAQKQAAHCSLERHGLPDPRRRQLYQSARQISETRERTVRRY